MIDYVFYLQGSRDSTVVGLILAQCQMWVELFLALRVFLRVLSGSPLS